MKKKILYWKPTIVTGIFLATTLRYFPVVYPSFPSFLWSSRKQEDEYCDEYDFGESCNNYEVENNHYNLYYYAIRIPSFFMESLFVATFVSNYMFGRRPITNWHNPISSQIAEAASTYFPTGMAVAYKAGVLVANTLTGGRAEGANHIASVAISAMLQASRIKLIEAGLYDSAMDRSPPIIPAEALAQSAEILAAAQLQAEATIAAALEGAAEQSAEILKAAQIQATEIIKDATFQTGQMRFIERVAMSTENGITYVIEAAAEIIYVVMESGISQLAIDDDNRLTALTTLYRIADIIEDILVRQLNEYAYYVGRWADIPAISQILLFMGFANDDIVVVGIVPKTTEAMLEGINDAFQGAVEDVGEVFQGAVDAVQHVAEVAVEVIHDAVENVGVEQVQVGFHHGDAVEVVDATKCCGLCFFGWVPHFGQD